MTCPSRPSVHWQRVSCGPMGEPSICLLNEWKFGVNSLSSTPGLLFWKTPTNSYLLLSPLVRERWFELECKNLEMSPSSMWAEGQRDFLHSHVEGQRVSEQALPHAETFFCSAACWHVLSVGALEPRAASDQPGMVSSRTNVMLKLCRLFVSFTRIILSHFYSNILSPQFSFSGNKMLYIKLFFFWMFVCSFLTK